MSGAVLSRLQGSTGLGFGGAPLGNLYSALDERSAGAALDRAWELGLRYFDTAPLYGHGLSETRMGRMLAGKPRDSFVLSTKVGRLLQASAHAPAEQEGYVAGLPFTARFDYSADGTLRSIEQSLRRLGLARLDMVYIHDVDRTTHGRDQPLRYREAIHGAYRALAQLRSEGVVGAIGLGVNEWEVCDTALDDADFDCFMLAGRYTLLDTTAARELVPLCIAKGVKLILAGVYNSGILAGGAASPAHFDYRPASAAMRDRVGRIAQCCAAWDVPLPAAALQFALACPCASAVVVGARSALEIAQSVERVGTVIPPGFWHALAAEGLLDAAVLPASRQAA